MRWLVDALLLAVVVSEVKTLIPPWTIIALNSYGNGGDFNLLTWNWVGSMPSSDFCLSFWVYVSTSTPSDPDILHIEFGTTQREFF